MFWAQTVMNHCAGSHFFSPFFTYIFSPSPKPCCLLRRVVHTRDMILLWLKANSRKQFLAVHFLSRLVITRLVWLQRVLGSAKIKWPGLPLSWTTVCLTNFCQFFTHIFGRSSEPAVCCKEQFTPMASYFFYWRLTAENMKETIPTGWFLGTVIFCFVSQARKILQISSYT